MSPVSWRRCARLLGHFSFFATVAVPGVAAAERPPEGSTSAIPLEVIRAGRMPKRTFQAVRLAGEPPAVDGRLDDRCWAEQGVWGGQLVQRQPREGQPATEPTEFKILYDDRHLYVAIRCFDSRIDELPFLRGKRDENSGDVVGVVFDSYFDKRTGFEFDVTAGGSQVDGLLLNYDFDTSWNAVYDVRVAKEHNAWTAEFRIPFSQLRYANKPEQVWGFVVWRWLQRNNEESNWQLIPQQNPGSIFSLGELHGIAGLPRSRRIELAPYVSGSYATTQAEAGNPLRTGSDSDFEAGLDAKIGLTSDMILDLTLNPDFGQVEADPAEINLTTFETFFPERRPFFLEGKTIFEWQAEDDLLFYSRRIGAPPRYRPPSTGWVEQPGATRILGAGKLTGKTAGGTSVGALCALSDEEHAEVFEDGEVSEVLVVPTTQQIVARVQQDFDKGRTTVGGMVTAVERDIGAEGPPGLAEEALTAGLDVRQYSSDRAWFLDAKLFASRISGSPEAITALMRNPVHNYQRPDADHLDLDPEADALSGWGGTVSLNKTGGGKWRLDAVVDWRSPGVELNDLGYLRVADLVELDAELSYVDTDPQAWWQRRTFRLNPEASWDWSGKHLGDEIELGASALFNNHWNIYAEVGGESEHFDTRVLRGGPALVTPGAGWFYTEIRSDNRKTWQAFLEGDVWRGTDGGSHGYVLNPGVDMRVMQFVNVEARLEYERVLEDLQYAGRGASAGGVRYIMGRMDQHTLGTSLRLEVNFTPRLSLAYFGHVLVSSGQYTRFKRVTQPRAAGYEDRFVRLDDGLAFDPATGLYTASAGGDTVTFADPDFDVRTLQSNLVLRWEYKAGSTFYAVWTQNREEAGATPGFAPGREYRQLFRAHPDNTFLVKMSYWFTL
ncbi:MAG: carbohydrate binding family 9 domain-containing protein [Opitutaceae bacterium]|nr:carbohydrate binding family 9 domain-containing protein [Opitutaceae bacterium]